MHGKWDGVSASVVNISATCRSITVIRDYRAALTQEYVDEILKPRNGVENVMKWACGRPLASDLTGTACQYHKSNPRQASLSGAVMTGRGARGFRRLAAPLVTSPCSRWLDQKIVSRNPVTMLLSICYQLASFTHA